jgi:prepilin-type processing-associated H-X9-DG protein
MVVLAIAAIVASMMLPGLAKAKARAQGMKCLSNMRQWGIALNVYAGESDDHLPRDGTDAVGEYSVDTGAESGPGSPMDPYAWFNVLPQGVDQQPLSNYWAESSRPREELPFPGGTGSFWHCPAARSTADDPFLRDGRYGFFSLVMNQDLKLLGSIRTETERNTFDYPAMPRLGTIPNPAVTVLLTDVAFSPTLEPYTPAPQRNGVFPAGRSAQFSQRHSSRGANIVFVDGHASFFKRSYITNGGPARGEKFNPDVVWNPNRGKL